RAADLSAYEEHHVTPAARATARPRPAGRRRGARAAMVRPDSARRAATAAARGLARPVATGRCAGGRSRSRGDAAIARGACGRSARWRAGQAAGLYRAAGHERGRPRHRVSAGALLWRLHPCAATAVEPDRACHQRTRRQGGAALSAVLDRRSAAGRTRQQRTGRSRLSHGCAEDLFLRAGLNWRGAHGVGSDFYIYSPERSALTIVCAMKPSFRPSAALPQKKDTRNTRPCGSRALAANAGASLPTASETRPKAASYERPFQLMRAT